MSQAASAAAAASKAAWKPPLGAASKAASAAAPAAPWLPRSMSYGTRAWRVRKGHGEVPEVDGLQRTG